MIGIVIVAHGKLAEHLQAATIHVVGPQEAIETVSIGADDDMEQRLADIIAAAQRVNDGSGVIILTDMFGGTPSNLAIAAMEKTGAEVIAGVNLPMLVKIASIRATWGLMEAVAAAHEAGRKYINVASWVLNGERR